MTATSIAAGSPASLRRRIRRAAGPLVVSARRLRPGRGALPDYLVLGAQKAGTSTLASQLAAHPSVLAPLRKEVHFFDRAPRSLGAYRAYFPLESSMRRVAARTGQARTGESTPYYLFHPAVPGRVRAAVPDVRLIAILRDPVARAVSGYHHAVRMGDESRPIEVALDPDHAEALAPLDDADWYDAPECPARARGYLARGRYAEQLARWLACFGREQLLVLATSSLTPGAASPEVLEFLGLPAVATPAVADRNVGSYRPVDATLERRLRAYFAPFDEPLWDLLGTRWDWKA